MESLEVGTTSNQHLLALMRDQTQPGLFSREKEEAGNKVWSPWGRDNFPTPPLPTASPDPTKVSLSKERRSRIKVWSPWAFGQLPHASPPYCKTSFNQGYSLVRRKKQGKRLESLEVGTTSQRLPALLRDQTQPGLFSREKEKAGNKVWSPWSSGQLPHPSPPYCVTRLNQGYSLVRWKKQGTIFGVPGRWENFSTPLLSAARPDSTRVTRVILS